MRSAIPGNVAIGRCCAPSNTRCSYTSSVITSRSCSTASPASAASSPRRSTVPVGLCGLLSTSARVAGVIGRGQRVEIQREPVPVGYQRDASPGGAGKRDRGGVGVVVGLDEQHLIALPDQGEQGSADRFGGTDGDQHLGIRIVHQAVAAARCSATAMRNSGMPGPGGYWLCPLAMADRATSSMPAGPSVSGKPWPRLTAPVRTASAVISAKIVEENGCSRGTSP